MLRPRLNIDHLAALAALDVAGGVQQAARLLHLTQPAMTYRLQELERRVGAALFAREGRNLRRTAAGDRLLDAARRILQELEAAESDCRKLAAGVREIVRVGARANADYRWLPRVLARFGHSHPQVEVELVPHPAGPPLQALLDGRIDIDIVAGKVARADVVSQLLFVDEMVALVSSANPLARKPFVTARELASQTYVTTSTTRQPGLEYERLFRPARVEPERFLQVGLTEAVVELVRVDRGVSVMSRWALPAALAHPDLQLLRVTRSGLFVRWHAVVRKSHPGDGAAHALVQALREELSGAAAAP